jgi:hypothetical protein
VTLDTTAVVIQATDEVTEAEVARATIKYLHTRVAVATSLRVGRSEHHRSTI